jgi:hypothetical protein
MVSVNPGARATPVHSVGASIRVTVNFSGGWPFIRIVIFAPTANGPSILAITMTSPGHWAGLVHTVHTSSALAEEWHDPPNGPFTSPMLVILPRFALLGAILWFVRDTNHVVLIHGAWARGELWGSARAAFDELGYTVHTPTLPHHELPLDLTMIGFCMGGGYAVMSAPRFDFAAAASINYGKVPEDAADALRGSCPVAASFGGKDGYSGHAAQRLERALTSLGVAHDVREYETLGHGFLNELPRFMQSGLNPMNLVLNIHLRDETAVEDAWKRIFAFFGTHVRGPQN